mmetsp:Transcript_75315/g.196357  ORF Transcript_75315/g.196357 Transcript_75315/m.196357 type:complete len:266 (-) Transcript_75315:66-863(-)
MAINACCLSCWRACAPSCTVPHRLWAAARRAASACCCAAYALSFAFAPATVPSPACNRSCAARAPSCASRSICPFALSASSCAPARSWCASRASRSLLAKLLLSASRAPRTSPPVPSGMTSSALPRLLRASSWNSRSEAWSAAAALARALPSSRDCWCRTASCWCFCTSIRRPEFSKCFWSLRVVRKFTSEEASLERSSNFSSSSLHQHATPSDAFESSEPSCSIVSDRSPEPRLRSRPRASASAASSTAALILRWSSSQAASYG